MEHKTKPLERDIDENSLRKYGNNSFPHHGRTSYSSGKTQALLILTLLFHKHENIHIPFRKKN